MEEGVTSTDVLAFQEQRHHETEKRKRDEEIAGKEDSRDSEERVSKDKGGKEEEKGIITSFISNLLVPRNREAENTEAKDDRMDREGSGKGGCKLEGDLGGGGIVDNLIYNLFQPSEAREREEDKGNENEERVSDVKIEEERGGGGGGGGGGEGGIIETLVSHLPITLPGNYSYIYAFVASFKFQNSKTNWIVN